MSEASDALMRLLDQDRCRVFRHHARAGHSTVRDNLTLTAFGGIDAACSAHRADQVEIASRAESAVHQRIRDARFPEPKTLDTFDFNASEIDPAQIAALVRANGSPTPRS